MSRSEREQELEKQIILLEQELKKVTSPPYISGIVLDLGKKSIKIGVGNSKNIYEFPVSDRKVKGREIKIGSRVILNDKLNIVDFSEFEKVYGEVVSVEQILEKGVLRVRDKGNSYVVVTGLENVKAGDEIIIDDSKRVALDKIGSKKTRYHLEKIPKVNFSDIGGLEHAINRIRKEIEEPFMNKEVYARYNKKPAKGVLLYGPPRCGKTLLAKAIAYRISQITGKEDGHFISIKGPEILDKFVGNTESYIRDIYSEAREISQENKMATIIFIDEAEALLKKRGTGISSDVHDTIVPQFLSEMDGLDENHNIITILASNRDDIIDPAVLQEERVDVKIRVKRPDQKGIYEISNIYLRDKPLSLKPKFKNIDEVSAHLAALIYDDKNIVYNAVANGNNVIGKFGYKNLVTGALVKDIVARACSYAIEREINKAFGKDSVKIEDLETSVHEKFRENADFEQFLTPDDWVDVFDSRGRSYHDLYVRGCITLENVLNHAQTEDVCNGG